MCESSSRSSIARPSVSSMVPAAGFACLASISIAGAAFRVHLDVHQKLIPALKLREDSDAIAVVAVMVCNLGRRIVGAGMRKRCRSKERCRGWRRLRENVAGSDCYEGRSAEEEGRGRMLHSIMITVVVEC